MQVSAGEHIGPSGQVLILGEVEHGHDGLGAPRQNSQLVFVFVEDGFPRIDDVHGHIALHDLAQNFGLLVKLVMRFMAGCAQCRHRVRMYGFPASPTRRRHLQGRVCRRDKPGCRRRR